MDHALSPGSRNRSVIVPLVPAPDPIELLARFASLPDVALLDGASDSADLGHFSYLSADPVASFVSPASDWPAVRERLSQTIDASFPHDAALPPFQGGWIGWLSYELGTAFDRMPRAPRDDLQTPDIALALYDWVIAWDHLSGESWLVCSGIDADGHCDPARAEARATTVLARLRDGVAATARSPVTRAAIAPGTVAIDAFEVAPPGLTGDFTPEAYCDAVQQVIDHICAGDLFQANLSQRFLAPFAGEPHALYRAMRRIAAAPMAACLARSDRYLLSASPELFLRLDPRSRAVETRPIKGTRPRGENADRDAALASELLASEKDRAENVMIVDLLRNDLSRVCTPESIQVPALCRLDTHAAVHHLVSIVTGSLRSEFGPLELIEATFPGGSITGAPKLRATEVIASLEPVTRGAYCGAIGWIGCDGGVEFSVAIRTITLAYGVAAIHAGGGITAQSDPEEEYQETLDKARALVRAVKESQ